MAGKTDTIDPFTTREGSLAVTEADLPRIIAGLRTKVSNVGKASANLTIAGAHATHAAFRLDADLTVSVLADKVGASRATVYMWRRLGVAVIDCGVEVGSTEWTRLAGNAGANAKPIAGILDGLGRDGLGDPATRKTKDGKVTKGDANILPTAEDLAWGLDMVFATAEDGTVTKRKTADVEKAIRVDAGEEPEPEESAAETPVAPVRSIDAQVRVMAAYLADNLAEVSDETWQAIAPAIRAIAAEARKRTAPEAAAS